MRKLDEVTALAIVFASTKRTKRSVDLITVAESLEYLVGLYKGSVKDVAEKVGLSTEMIREFRRLLKLPEEVRKLIASRQIDRVDVAYRISMLEDPAQQIAAAKKVAGLPSKDVRDILRLMQKANLSAEESRRMVLESKPKNLHIFVMDLDDETYAAIIEEAKSRDTDPAELAKRIIIDWLGRRRKPKGK